jgi:nucleotide-binding universal stress UspA family protein
MNKILVPTDFSDCAKNALRVAAKIAKRVDNAVITLVHVYEKPVYGMSLQFGVDQKQVLELQEELKAEMRKAADQPFLEGLEVRRAFIADADIWDIMEHDIIGPQDIIVMGTHGVKGVKDLFIGSNAEKLIRKSRIPVLTVKENEEDFDFSDLVFASDFEADMKEKFPMVHNFAKIFSSKIHLLKIVSSDAESQKNLANQSIDKFATEMGIENYTKNVVYNRNIEDGILEFSTKINADVIAMETHGRTGIAHVINGSVTEDLANHAQRYVLSIKI